MFKLRLNREREREVDNGQPFQKVTFGRIWRIFLLALWEQSSVGDGVRDLTVHQELLTTHVTCHITHVTLSLRPLEKLLPLSSR